MNKTERNDKVVEEANRLRKEIGGVPALMVDQITFLIDEIAILRAHIFALEDRDRKRDIALGVQREE